MSGINIKDVARHAGVSAMTITRTLKAPELVKETTRVKVRNAIDELGYVPNYTASVLRSAKSNTVGITLFDIENPFISKLVMRLEKNLKKYNYTTLISFANEAEVNDYDVYAKLKTFNVDLLLFIPTLYDEKLASLPAETSSKMLQLFRNVYKNIDSFTVDDPYGAYVATKYLLENGHTDILLVDYDQRLPLYRDRGYFEAFAEKNIACDKNNVLYLDEFDDSRYADTIAEKINNSHPTAILAVTQKLCTSCISAISQLGLELYDDVSLVGYDDTVLTQYLGITTIAHPFEEIIDDITAWAVNKIEGGLPAEPPHIQVKPFLRLRNSVKNLN